MCFLCKIREHPNYSENTKTILPILLVHLTVLIWKQPTNTWTKYYAPKGWTDQRFEPMTFWPWQYVSCHWNVRSNHAAIGDVLNYLSTQATASSCSISPRKRHSTISSYTLLSAIVSSDSAGWLCLNCSATMLSTTVVIVLCWSSRAMINRQCGNSNKP